MKACIDLKIFLFLRNLNLVQSYKIIDSLANLDVKLGSITQALEKEAFQVGKYVQLYLQLDYIIQAIGRTV